MIQVKADNRIHKALLYFGIAALLFVYSGLSLSAFAAEKITVDVTGIATGDQVSHDCQNYLIQGYDQNNHWQQCQICGKKYNISQHKFTESWLNGDLCGAQNKLMHQCKCGYEYDTENTIPHKDIRYIYNDREYARVAVCYTCGDWVFDQMHYCYDSSGNRLSCTNPGTCAECGHTYEIVHEGIPHTDEMLGTLQPLYIEGTQVLANGYKINCQRCGKYLGQINQIKFTYLHNSDHEIRVDYDFTLANNPQLSGYERWVVENGKQRDVQTNYDQQTGHLYGQTIVSNNYAQMVKINNTCIFHGRLSNGEKVEIGALTKPVQVDTQPVILKSSLTDFNTLDGWSTGKRIDLAGTTDYLQALTVNIYDNQTKYADNIGFSSDDPQQMGEATWQYSVIPDIEADENGKDITISVKNNAGLETKKIIRVSKVDKVAPVLDSSNESTGNWTKQRDYTAIIYDGGIGQVETQLNSVDSWVKADSIDEQIHHDYKQQYKFTGDAYKPVTLALNIKDGLGNQRAEKITVDKLDNTKPHVVKTVLETNNGYSIKVYGNDIKDGLGEGSHIQKYMIIKDADTEPTSNQDSRWIPWDGGYAESGTSSDTEAIMYFITDDTQINSDGQYKVYLIDNAGNISDAYETEVRSTNQSLVTIDVTGLITSSDIGHDCQKYLTDEYDQNNHWQRCTICDRKYNIQAHTMTPGYWTGGTAQNCISSNLFVRTCTNQHCGYETKTQTGRAEHKFSSEISYNHYLVGYKICTVCGDNVIVCECTIHGKKPGCDVEGYCDKCGHYWQRLYHFTLADAIYDQHGKEVYSKGEIVYNGYTTQHRCIYCGKVCMTVETTATQLTGNKVQYKLIVRPLNGGKVQQIQGPYFTQANGQSLINQAVDYQISGDRSYATIWYTVTPQPGMHIEQDVRGYASISCTDETGRTFACGLFPVSSGVTNSVDVTAPQINSILYKDISDDTWTVDENTEWSTSKQIKVDGHEEYANTVYLRLFDLDGQTDTTGYYKDLGDPVVEAQQAVGSTGQYTLQQMPGIEADENGHKYRLVVSDQLNNDVVKDITVKKIDRVAPKIDTIDSTQTEWSKSKTVKLYGTDKGINQVSINFNDLVPLERDNCVLNATTSGYEYNQEVKLIGDVYGSVAANVTYTDGLGNGTNKRLKIYNLDNTNPTITEVVGNLNNDYTYKIYGDDRRSDIGEGQGISEYLVKETSDKPSETDSNWQVYIGDRIDTGDKSDKEVYMTGSVAKAGTYYAFVKDAVGNISDGVEFQILDPVKLWITATPDNSGYGSVMVDWSTYDYRNKNFKVYRSNNGVDYESVGIDYKQIKNLKLLQVYPIDDAKNQMKDWLVTSGYGKGIIQVEQVQIDEFSSNPQYYMKNTNGTWKYDVVLFGTWDGNANKDISEEAYNITDEFLRTGHGCVFGHDTLRGEATDGQITFPQLYKLRHYLSISQHNETFYNGQDSFHTGDAVQKWDGQSTIKIVKSGLLVNYPNMVGDINTLLSVPICHNYQHIGLQPDHIWMRFYHPQYQQDDMNNGYNFYLAQIENLAMIQTGHSKGLATSDEQKVLANTVFYVNQLIFSKYQNKDYAAQDTTAPTIPSITNSVTKYQFTSEDEGNHYWFYVESYNKDGIAPENYIETSNIAQVDVVTGLAGYYYVIDTSKNTTVTKTGQGVQYIDKDVDSIDPGVTNQTRYLHVAAVDNAGNLSGTATIEIPAKLIINYDKNGADGTETMQPQELLAGQSIKIRDNEFTYTRHRFTNWNTDKSNNGDIYKPGDSISYSVATPKYGYNLTLYAIWEQLYKLQVDPNKGKYNESTGIAEYWLGNKEEKEISDATRIGYNFKGWTINIIK